MPVTPRRWRIFDAQPRAIKEIGWETGLEFSKVVPAGEVAEALAAVESKIASSRVRLADCGPRGVRRGAEKRLKAAMDREKRDG